MCWNESTVCPLAVVTHWRVLHQSDMIKLTILIVVQSTFMELLLSPELGKHSMSMTEATTHSHGLLRNFLPDLYILKQSYLLVMILGHNTTSHSNGLE